MKKYTDGFTLIELLWSIAIASILSSVGIAAFFNYSRLQAFNGAVSQFTTMLEVAKSRAQSQVKPDSCSGDNNPLVGYKVLLNTTGEYKLLAECGTETNINDYEIANQKGQLPPQMNFTCLDNSKPYFLFYVLTGTTDGSKFVQIQAYNSVNTIKRISVQNAGVIQVQNGEPVCTTAQ